MPFKVQVGPPQIAIHQAMTVLVTESDGQINWPSDKGLYFFDTRLISAWSVYANGTPWDLLNGGAVNFDAARIFLTNQAFLTEDGPIPRQTLAFEIVPRAGPGAARRPGYHQPRPEAGPLQPGDRHPFGFRRRVRRQGQARHPPRPHHLRLGGGAADLAHHLPQRRFFPLRRGFGGHERLAGGVRQRPAELRGQAAARAAAGIAACCTNSPMATNATARRKSARSRRTRRRRPRRIGTGARRC